MKPKNEKHAVFVTLAPTATQTRRRTLRVSKYVNWDSAIALWDSLDTARRLGFARDVLHFEVRAKDDPQERYAKAKLWKGQLV